MISSRYESRLFGDGLLDFKIFISSKERLKDLQKGKLDGVCPSWKRQNAFMGVMRLLRARRRASHWASLGKAFHVPDEANRFPLSICLMFAEKKTSNNDFNFCKIEFIEGDRWRFCHLRCSGCC